MPTWQYDKSVRTTRRELWHVARRACVGNSYVTNARNTNGRPTPVWVQDVHQNGHFLIHYSSIPRASFGVDFAEPSASDACPWPRDSRDLGRQWCCLMSRIVQHAYQCIYIVVQPWTVVVLAGSSTTALRSICSSNGRVGDGLRAAGVHGQAVLDRGQAPRATIRTTVVRSFAVAIPRC